MENRVVRVQQVAVWTALFWGTFSFWKLICRIFGIQAICVYMKIGIVYYSYTMINVSLECICSDNEALGRIRRGD